MKKLLLTLMTILLMLVLVGCGGTTSTDSSSDSASSDEKDLASITEEVKTKIKDGESDVTKDVQDALDTDSNLVGTWKATDATVSDTQKGNYELILNEDTKYNESISYVDANGAVDASAPNETFSGVYLVKDNSIALLPDKATVNGEEKTGQALYEPEDYGRTYDYEVSGDKLTLTNPETKEVIEFTKG